MYLHDARVNVILLQNLPRSLSCQRKLVNSVTNPIVNNLFRVWHILKLFLIECSRVQHVRYQPRLRVTLMMTSPPDTDTADPFRFGRSSLISTLPPSIPPHLCLALFISTSLSAFSILFVSELWPLFAEDSVGFLCLPWAAEPHKHLQFRPLQSTLTSTTFVADSLLIFSV